MTQVRNFADLAEAYAAGALSLRNKFINGGFDIWQRGTSKAALTQADQFLADRWNASCFTGTTVELSQQVFALGQTDVPGNPRFYSRVKVVSGGAAASLANYSQRIEGIAGNLPVAVSIWLKADAPKFISAEFAQRFGSGGSASAEVNALGVLKVALTTAWQKFIFPVTYPSIVGKVLGTDGKEALAFNLWMDAGSDFAGRTASLGNQSGTFDFAQAQFEYGNIVTPFEQRPLGMELTLCQRFYEQGQEPFLYLGGLTNTSAAYGEVRFLTQKRAVPTINHANFAYWSGGTDTPMGITVDNVYVHSWRFKSVGLVNFNGWNGTGTWNASAEL